MRQWKALRRRFKTKTRVSLRPAPLRVSAVVQTRVRFAPSPTGNLHVGGARTALFNYLYASNTGGKLILRVEDTDQARSTPESEAAVLQDLEWIGIKWDEGPDVGGQYGPYRQSERKDLYTKYVNKLVDDGLVYPCFCTDEELAEMKAEAERKSLPPIYRGKWAHADQKEVDEMLAQGKPHCYRFRVPSNKTITITDSIRGKVSWNTDSLGDFVVMRSNGLPVYNFCVAVDDATMKISHVIRAEEHLPNTLRQVLIYRALGWKQPQFSHVSLILAPDKSKLSKRHGATSLGEFRQQGYLPQAMLNYLTLLGWNDGSEQEVFTLQQLQEKFSLERVTKSGAVFDKTKLSWMNGQHLRALPDTELAPQLAEVWQHSGLLQKQDSPFVQLAVAVLKPSLELLADADRDLRHILSYPLMDTLQHEAATAVLQDNFKQIVDTALAAYDSGGLKSAVESGPDGYKTWLKGVGKEQKRKGKHLYMPMRVALTGSQHGPEVGEVLRLLLLEDGDIKDSSAYVSLPQRMQQLQEWQSRQTAS
ncbi:MAG: glutamate--tRNA chloroplastic mitochondrial-like [Trebouxia sp. A1-2]|nr:MAG: glutamate--tRNA chloroplastic mitochondrial-like [Trebouxia sp. A1-2]